MALDLSSYVHLTLDTEYIRPYGLIYAEFMKAQWDASFPYTVRHRLVTDEEFDAVDVLPEGATVVRQAVYAEDNQIVLATAKDAIYLVIYDIGEAVEALVAAKSVDLAWEHLNSLMEDVPETVTPEDSVSLNVWHLGGQGPSATRKKIKAPRFSDIQRNYPGDTGTALAELMKIKRPEGNGKLILWHGPPGTGKTTALRSLAHAWKDWCAMHYVSDPEKLFHSTSYLFEVAGGKYDRFRLVVCEDTDELLRASARMESGASLGRLLNFSDGILGQGSDTIFLLTTNEKLDTLHPAITRPGRCLANIHFPAMTNQQASEWLGYQAPSGSHSLAELIELQGKKRIRHEKPQEEYGQYL